MSIQLEDHLKAALEACKKVVKSGDGEFSYKWLRNAGCKFHSSALTKIVDLGLLAVSYNGINRRGTAWYRVQPGV